MFQLSMGQYNLTGLDLADWPYLQSFAEMDNKIVQSVIIILVIGVQAVHIASATTSLDYIHLVDDSAGISYNAWNATTKKFSYQIAFALVVVVLTVLFYGLLLAVKLAGLGLSAKIQELLFGAVAVLQFSLAVLLAITQARLVDPRGPNATAAIYKTDVYRIKFDTELADVVLLWIICVPGSYLLSHIHSPQIGEDQSKGNTAGEGLKVQNSELQINN